MNANFDYENIKSLKIPKSYENKHTSYKTNDFVNREAFKEKLSILESNIKYSNPNKNLQKNTNRNFENNNNYISNFINLGNKSERIIENEGINNSIKLMDIKLNHQILQNKIENMRKTLLKETNDSNYNTITTSNYIESKHLDSFNNIQNNYITPKNYNDRIKFDDNFELKDKENNLNFNNLRNENIDYLVKNNYFTSRNFYYQKDFFKSNNDQTSETLRDSNYRKNKGINNLDKDNEEVIFSKTIGNFDFDRNSILTKFKINNNEMKLDYKKKDLIDLEGKIQTSKKKLNKCINRAETLVIDKRKNNKIFDEDILNENSKQFANHKRLDAKTLRDFESILI
jgi:hypothetical protein